MLISTSFIFPIWANQETNCSRSICMEEQRLC